VKNKPLLVFLLCAAMTFVPVAVIRALSDSGEDFEFEWLSKPTNFAGLDFTEGRVWVQKKENGPWTLYDESWNVLKAGFDADTVSPFRNGVSCYWVKGTEGHTLGLLNLSGDAIIPPSDYGTAGGYYDGFMPKMGENDRLGFVNASGDWMIPPAHNYEYAYAYDGNYFYVYTGEMKRGMSGQGVIDRQGREAVPKMERVTRFSSGLIAIQPVKDGEWGYLNENGELAIYTKFDAAGNFMDGAAIVKEGSLYGLIDESGKYIVKPKYEHAYPSGAEYQNLRPVALNGKAGYIDSKGKTVIDFKFMHKPSGFLGDSLEAEATATGKHPAPGHRAEDPARGLYIFKKGRAAVMLEGPGGSDSLGVIDEAGNIVYRVDGVKRFFGFDGGDYLPLVTDEGFCVFDRDGRKYSLSGHVPLPSLDSVSVYEGNIFGIRYTGPGENAGYFKMTPTGGRRQ
jgi:hypothetical protein